MSKQNPTKIDILREDKERAEQWRREVALIERKNIPQTELMGRLFKSENLKKMVLDDAKKRKGGFNV